MKKLIFLLFVTFSLNSFSQHNSVDWNTDMNKSIELSEKTEKPILLFFTGSDWCGWCKKLVREVFAKPEFSKWAKENVILVEIDFPRKTKLSAELQKQNRSLQQMFGVRGYPTVWFVTPQPEAGKVNFNQLGSQGASPLDAKAWIAGANKILNTK